ncbi:DNA-3-methyladenine glycosylase 2 family protein [Flavobacterium sp. CYK-4]|uniref:DNA-3-methyladenine glycosylase family protein n=1 Tax=Flavobacterium lotistagni TaxID=2709660 RepID=UPI00140BE950|nr:DNA-3-methyladenine glycosylase 2 family protein [Flavobacterium lotistagni]NHM08123.1 DNA-3-methyladenine glycosylase 2 family protein [Flavobacterium lotistagni]
MQEAIDYLTQREPVFQKIIDTYGLPKIPYRPPGFETLVLLILEQQVSIDSAKATYLKLKTKAGAIAPQTLVDIADEDFRSVGVSRQKTGYIKGLAQIILNNKIELEGFAQKSAEEVRQELIKIKGIGHWTIDVYLMFSLEASDVMPFGDVAVVNTIKELFDIHDKTQMENFALQWAPYRSMATFLLWHHYLNKRGRTIEYIY